MFDLLDSLIAVAAIILGLSLLVQALQQIFKQWLELKAEYMLNELFVLFGDMPQEKTTLSGLLPSKTVRANYIKKNPDSFSSRLIAELETVMSGLGFRDLHLLENLETESFVNLLKSLPLSKETNADIQKKFQDAVENASHWFNLTKQSFQEHYERRMKYWSFGLSAAVVIALNANLLDIYQEFSRNAVLRDAAVSMAEQLTSISRDSLIVSASDGKKDSTFVAATPDSTIVQQINANAVSIQKMLDEQSFQVMGWSDARLKNYDGKPWYWTVSRFFLGLFGMTLLVSLGAPFWYDLLKMVMGIKNSLQKK
ncbi:MAG: hypothetical protein M0R68_01665 [Bacteroidetes bacterium]|nr:hypothetical protein [Bacteroidota bacterium]